jgi:hypothetical protein
MQRNFAENFLLSLEFRCSDVVEIFLFGLFAEGGCSVENLPAMRVLSGSGHLSSGILAAYNMRLMFDPLCAMVPW